MFILKHLKDRGFMKANDMWNKFKILNNIETNIYDVWSFGDNPDYLASLVLNKEKTATSSLYILYELKGKKLPKIGDYSVILNSSNEAVCIIKTTNVYITTFNEITQMHAYKEGEGDKSLKYYKEIHEKFFNNCLKPYNMKFTSDMKIVCEEFILVFY